MVFYHAAQPYLAPYKPVLKFLMIKTIIFVSFWQSLVLAVLYWFGALRPIPGLAEAQSAVKLQSFLICVEALPAAVANFAVFPPLVTADEKTGLLRALRHATQVLTPSPAPWRRRHQASHRRIPP